MKKFILGVMCLGMLASCNVKDSKEYKALQAQRDSLLQANNTDNTQISDLMSIVEEVENNFSQIKEAEKYLTVESATKGEMTTDTKTKVRENFQMVNDILNKNKQQIEELNKKLKNSGNASASLKQTINRLTSELQERTTALEQLKNVLVQRDQQISDLNNTVSKLNDNVQDLSSKNADQASTIKEQEKALNTGYYIFGTSKELKEAKILTGGFLSSPKVLRESIDKSIFIRIDIRDVREIPVYAKKAKVLSDQPSDSYTISKDVNGQAIIRILDYKKFWSLGQFLIIQVD